MNKKQIFATYYNSLSEPEKLEFIEQLKIITLQKHINNINNDCEDTLANFDLEMQELFSETKNELQEMRESLEDLKELLDETQIMHQTLLYDEFIKDLDIIKKEQNKELSRQIISETVKEYQHLYKGKKKIYFQ